MKPVSIISILFFFILGPGLFGQTVTIRGYVKNQKTSEGIENVVIKDVDGAFICFSSKTGYFSFKQPKKDLIKIHFTHSAFHSFTKEIRTGNGDTININVSLTEKPNLLDSITVLSVHKPETLVGKPNYSIYDFDFYEDKLILLTAEKSLSKARLQFSDYSGKIISDQPLPIDGGKAQCFFHDYEGYTDLICSDTIFRLDIMNNNFLLMPINKNIYERTIKPVSDTANASIYYSDQWEKYPLFNYYFIRQYDTANHHLATVSNPDLLKIYNMEYYYLPPVQQLEARRIATKYKTDKRIVAALMSGFTKSMYYEPVYAPLFVLNDTVCIFNHYTDYIYHFDGKNKLIDSVKISYHHPKSWREWKKQLYVDRYENKVYAFFSKDGHHYLKEINHRNGIEVKTYKLKHHSAERIKIRDGYVYYIYRPFDSTQEKFLYRELIE
jgi:hypothetical protein